MSKVLVEPNAPLMLFLALSIAFVFYILLKEQEPALRVVIASFLALLAVILVISEYHKIKGIIKAITKAIRAKR